MFHLRPPIAALGCRIASSPATPVILASAGADAEPSIASAIVPFLLLAGAAVWVGSSILKSIPNKAST